MSASSYSLRVQPPRTRRRRCSCRSSCTFCRHIRPFRWSAVGSMLVRSGRLRHRFHLLQHRRISTIAAIFISSNFFFSSRVIFCRCCPPPPGPGPLKAAPTAIAADSRKTEQENIFAAWRDISPVISKLTSGWKQQNASRTRSSEK